MQPLSVAANATTSKDAGAPGGGSHTAKGRKRRDQTTSTKAALVARKASNLKKKWQTETKKKASAETLRSRLAKLHDLGVMPGQIADILELSYAGARGITTGELNPHEDKLKGYHERITAWCRKVARI